MPRKPVKVLVSDVLAAAVSSDTRTAQYRSIEPFISIARWIPRSISAFINLDHVFDVGLGELQPHEYTENDTFAYEFIMQQHDLFPAVMKAFADADDEGYSLRQFLIKMTTAMREARAQDTNTIKGLIIGFLPHDPTKESVHPPIVIRQKAARGWNHPWTARALCPLEYVEDFDRDPVLFMTKVQKGQVQFTASQLPSFLYPHDAKWDPNDRKRGLFRGHVFIRCMRVIFTGASSALTGYRAASRDSIAELNGMVSVTEFTVAYGACQAYCGISNLEQWGAADGKFKLPRFEKVIMKILSDRSKKWVSETLEYIDSQLPALTRRRKRKRSAEDNSDEEDDEDDDPTGILKELSEDEDDAKETSTRHSTPATMPVARVLSPLLEANQGTSHAPQNTALEARKHSVNEESAKVRSNSDQDVPPSAGNDAENENLPPAIAPQAVSSKRGRGTGRRGRSRG